LIDHAPEILNSGLKRSLCSYEKLIILLDGRVDVVSIDIRVIYVFVSLKKAHSGVLD